MKVVILQPAFFPWPGVFEQIALADIYVHLDDVQLPLGRSLISRIKIKTPSGPKWLTVPVIRKGKQLINEVLLDDSGNWRRRHIKTLRHCYAKAPFVEQMLELVESVYFQPAGHLAQLNIAAIERITEYLGYETEFKVSSRYNVKSKGSEKLLELVKILNGDTYITGHGALNYLDHELFEKNGVRIEYIDYNRTPWPQLHGEFDPHVSVLDLIANAGAEGVKYMNSGTVYWKDFVAQGKTV